MLSLYSTVGRSFACRSEPDLDVERLEDVLVEVCHKTIAIVADRRRRQAVPGYPLKKG